MIFIDTNVLVFANQRSAPRHAEALAALKGIRAAKTTLWISRQVMREYLAVLTRFQTFAAPTVHDLAIERIRRFEHLFQVAEDGPAVTTRLLELLAHTPCGGKQIHDANIVATMLVHGIGRLLTDNVADFARFGTVIEVLPLVRS